MESCSLKSKVAEIDSLYVSERKGEDLSESLNTDVVFYIFIYHRRISMGNCDEAV